MTRNSGDAVHPSRLHFHRHWDDDVAIHGNYNNNIKDWMGGDRETRVEFRRDTRGTGGQTFTDKRTIILGPTVIMQPPRDFGFFKPSRIFSVL